jgi:hypothetical protein
MTKNELQTYAATVLGYPAIKVELFPQHYDIAIDNALLLFNNYLFDYEARISPQQTDAVSIQLTSDIIGVLKVDALIPRDDSQYLQMSVFELVYRMVYPKLPVGEWYQLRSFYEMYQRIRGIDPDWHYDETTHTLYADCHGGVYDLCYVVMKKLSLESITAGLGPYESLFRKAVVAYCKRTLALIRGKFANIPSPGGGSLSTDASSLEGQGAAELKEVEQALRDTRPPAPIIVG